MATRFCFFFWPGETAVVRSKLPGRALWPARICSTCFSALVLCWCISLRLFLCFVVPTGTDCLRSEQRFYAPRASRPLSSFLSLSLALASLSIYTHVLYFIHTFTYSRHTSTYSRHAYTRRHMHILHLKDACNRTHTLRHSNWPSPPPSRFHQHQQQLRFSPSSTGSGGTHGWSFRSICASSLAPVSPLPPPPCLLLLRPLRADVLAGSMSLPGPCVCRFLSACCHLLCVASLALSFVLCVTLLAALLCVVALVRLCCHRCTVFLLSHPLSAPCLPCPCTRYLAILAPRIPHPQWCF